MAQNDIRNIIVVMFDTLRPDHLGCYGNKWMKTPNLDRVAGESMVFDRAVAEALPTVQVTGPSLIKSGQPDGGTIAAIQKLPPAHSRTDIAVLIPAANVLHAGDLIEVGAYPFIDWWAGGTLQGMIEEVGRIVAWAQGDQRIVPGHGPVIGAAELAEYLEMLTTVRDRAETAIRRGDSEEAFLDSRPTREFDAGRGGEASGRRFASLVWYGLSRGD